MYRELGTRWRLRQSQPDTGWPSCAVRIAQWFMLFSLQQGLHQVRAVGKISGLQNVNSSALSQTVTE